MGIFEFEIHSGIYFVKLLKLLAYLYMHEITSRKIILEQSKNFYCGSYHIVSLKMPIRL